MKKRILFLCSFILIVLTLTSCCPFHDYQFDHVVAPTCEKEGYTVNVCKKCGAEEHTNVLEALGHTYDHTITTDSTCEEPGKNELVCARCNEVYETTTIEATGHHGGKPVTTYATCETDGHIRTYCVDCGKVLEEEALLHQGHNPKERITSYPDCVTEGSYIVYCSICNETLDICSIPATGHDPVEVDEIPATCLESGVTSGHVCDACGVVLDGCEEIEPLGHDMITSTLKTDYGHEYTAYHCSRCDYIETRKNLKLDYTKLRGYNYLLTEFENGVQMTNFYRALYDYAYYFTYTSTEDLKASSTTETYQTIKKFIISCTYAECESHINYDLTTEEAGTVWAILVHENPEFLFLYNGYSYGSSSEYHGLVKYTTKYFNLCVSKDYYQYSYRKSVLEALTQQEIELSAKMKNVTGYGNKAKAIHDFIIDKIDYAYIEGTTTAETAKWAHNMVGLVMNYGGVCECYAKSYLYYSYLFNINSICVYNSKHAWNMTEYNGLWYGMDLTWDDLKEGKVKYQYFGATEEVMASGHVPGEQTLGIGYEIPIPTYGTTAWRLLDGKVILPTYA